MHATVIDISATTERSAAAQYAAKRFLRSQGAVDIEAIGAHSNFNDVFCCHCAGKRYFLKAAHTRPRTLDLKIPRSRIFTEARALDLFGEWCGELIEIPRMLHMDRQSFSFLMTDVGMGRTNLIDAMAEHYDLYILGIAAMAQAIGQVHRRSRGWPSPCPSRQSDALRTFIYDNLIAPGISALVGESARSVLEEMATRRECLIHSDLWAKNMLIDSAGGMALVDYEGVLEGDPAFDLATMLAAGVLPLFQYGISFDIWQHGARQVFLGYRQGLSDDAWFQQIEARLMPCLAVMLATRATGPFPYAMSDTARWQLSELCCQVIEQKLETWSDFPVLVRKLAPAQRQHH
ncbi:phosphotransferase family protein [Allohahella sp. A8]|uniref:phosphotransferase family protein n=1 Tax=Allohahella sp. A8 TaxID=3141461 RepID=UPI003A801FD5